jgi:hypothetical protein
MKRTQKVAAALVLLGTLTLMGCGEKKKANEPEPLAKLTAYTPKEAGGWLNVNDVWEVKKNVMLEFKKFEDWIGISWYGITRMGRSGVFVRPADTIYNIREDKDGANPSIIYTCPKQRFAIDYGTEINSIVDGNKETSHVIFRFDNTIQYAEKAYQTSPRRTKRVNTATGEINGIATGVPETYQTSEWQFIDQIKNSDPMHRLLTARTIEFSAVDNPENPRSGVYAKWNLQKPLKEQKESGELDRACKALIGADYITVAMVEQQIKAETKAKEQKKNAARVNREQN